MDISINLLVARTFGWGVGGDAEGTGADFFFFKVGEGVAAEVVAYRQSADMQMAAVNL